MSSTAPATSPLLRILDIVAGIALALIGAGIGLTLASFVTALGGPASQLCVDAAVDGMRCNPVFLSGVTAGAWGAIVVAWFIGAGTFLMRVIRRRVAFWTPLVAIVVIIVAFYIVAALIGTSYAPVN